MEKTTKARLLIIDDEPHILEIINYTLTRRGYEVLTTTDARWGLELMKSSRPDLVLLDIHMPKLDGLETLREIHEIDPHLGVIVMTGYVEADRAKLLMKEGACDFVTKPIDFDYLENSIEANLLVRS